jgi:two-component system, NtrC family, response regulator AtoC
MPSDLVRLAVCVAPAPEPDERPAPVVAPRGAMRELLDQVERLGPSDLSVLILGETGVGKERLAVAVHLRSRRAGRPLLRINCGALSESLLESELFGYERGAFTGAQQRKLGLLETANGGSVFLDEIGELPVSIQVKLLRVIEQRELTRLGALQPVPLDVRFISATNRDLEAEVARGTFRRDCYFRLNGFTLAVPPLRDRLDELVPLVAQFLGDASARMGRAQVPAITDASIEVLRRHAWPGNIRELRNVIERAIVLCTDDTITPAHLPSARRRTTDAPATAAPRRDRRSSRISTHRALPDEVRAQSADLERRRIAEALASCGGNQTRAAKLLGIGRSTLIKRIQAHGLTRPRRARPTGR